jgi:hypothetical protein
MGSLTAVAMPVAVDLPIALRPANPEETRLVQATWARGMRAPRSTVAHSLAEVRLGDTRVNVDRALWMRAHHLLVDALLESSKIVVAVDPELPGLAIGWAVYDGSVLHYVYVSPAVRRCKVATKLVLHTRCSSASHMTQLGRGLVRHLGGEADQAPI